MKLWVINSFMTEVPIIQKPTHWFARLKLTNYLNKKLHQQHSPCNFQNFHISYYQKLFISLVEHPKPNTYGNVKISATDRCLIVFSVMYKFKKFLWSPAFPNKSICYYEIKLFELYKPIYPSFLVPTLSSHLCKVFPQRCSETKVLLKIF